MASTSVRAKIFWIPEDLGGHRGSPWEGMRPRYRSLKFFDKQMGDLAISAKEFQASEETGVWRTTIEFPLGVEEAIASEGSQFELLDGSRVIAIGVVSEMHGQSDKQKV